MNIHFRFFICLLALVTISGCNNYQVIEPDFDRSFTDYLTQTTDEATKAANLLILRELPLDDELTEIRIWVWYGAMIVKNFYSIDLSEGVSGRFIRYFDPPKNQWTDEEYLGFIDDVYSFCDKLGAFNETQACVDTEYEVRWALAYEELMELGVWNIPDESELPKYVKNDIFILDGTHVLVELKKPGLYRSYSHKYDPFASKKNDLYANKILNILNKYTK